MENIEITSMSSRGQVVIPLNLRKRLNLLEGEKFIVMGDENTLVLKKVERPSKEELLKRLKKIAEEGRKNAESLGIKESDVPKIVHRFRGVKD